MKDNRKFYKVALGLGSLVISLCVLFVLFEFSCRVVKVLKNIRHKTYAVNDQKWRIHDELLGWVNKYNSDALVGLGDDEFSFSVNSQGFRGKQEYHKDNPNRIIALGDSFTFGYGENDDETYPYYLEQELKEDFIDIEVVNMSCTAYGLDQEYLWFKRDGIKLNGKVLVLGILDINFSRSTLSRWIQGENKPRFKITNRGLKLTNVPVPEPCKVGSPRMARMDIFDTLFNWKGSYFLSFVRDRLYRLNLLVTKEFPEYSESFRLGKEILGELKLLCGENNIKLIIVLLPKSDWEQDLQPIYYSIKNLDKELGIEIIDMVEVFNNHGSWRELYNRTGHFSPAGNKLVAKTVYDHLKMNSGLN